MTIRRIWQLARRYWFNTLVVALVGTGIAGAAVRVHHGVDGPRGPLWFDVLAVLAMSLPLFARRRYPVGSLVAVGIAVGASSFVDGRVVTDNFVWFVQALGVCLLFGLMPKRAVSLAGLAFVLGVGAIVTRNDPAGHWGDLGWDGITFSIAWIVGFALGGKVREVDQAKELAAQAEQEREEQAVLAVADERARIARELHDVVGHSVSVMTVQASAVRRLLRPDQEKQLEALLVVEQTGREALAEMRRMVGVLRRPEESPALAPQPSLEQVDKLVTQARQAGLPVELLIEGETVQLPAGIDMTAYRLVQEGLTNAVKHAQATQAHVTVRYVDGHVEVTVSDNGNGVGGGDGSGHGLLGIRERISVYGGELEAGPQAGGGYRLRARLPLT
jgi:signal transduction histidine kinase